MWVEMGGVSGEESIGFFTPAAGQLPRQQGQRVPTAPADAVAEGEGLGPWAQAGSPGCCGSTFATLLSPDSHPAFPGVQVPVSSLWAFHHPLEPRPSVLVFCLPHLPCSLKSEVLLGHCCGHLLSDTVPTPIPSHVVSELVKRCFL